MIARASLFLLGIVFLAGCGGVSRSTTYPVSGKVTGGTGSLAGVTINFTPVDEKGTSSTGTIQADGSYTLQTSDGRKGAEAGKYKITLAMSPEATKQAMMDAMKASAGKTMTGPPTQNLPFPSKYQSGQTSDKTVEVTPSTTTLDIQL